MHFRKWILNYSRDYEPDNGNTENKTEPSLTSHCEGSSIRYFMCPRSFGLQSRPSLSLSIDLQVFQHSTTPLTLSVSRKHFPIAHTFTWMGNDRKRSKPEIITEIDFLICRSIVRTTFKPHYIASLSSSL